MTQKIILIPLSASVVGDKSGEFHVVVLKHNELGFDSKEFAEYLAKLFEAAPRILEALQFLEISLDSDATRLAMARANAQMILEYMRLFP